MDGLLFETQLEELIDGYLSGATAPSTRSDPDVRFDDVVLTLELKLMALKEEVAHAGDEG
jgi:hypothetical protein